MKEKKKKMKPKRKPGPPRRKPQCKPPKSKHKIKQADMIYEVASIENIKDIPITDLVKQLGPLNIKFQDKDTGEIVGGCKVGGDLRTIETPPESMLEAILFEQADILSSWERDKMDRTPRKLRDDEIMKIYNLVIKHDMGAIEISDVVGMVLEIVNNRT